MAIFDYFHTFSLFGMSMPYVKILADRQNPNGCLFSSTHSSIEQVSIFELFEIQRTDFDLSLQSEKQQQDSTIGKIMPIYFDLIFPIQS